jgi:hypothetical protein
MSCEFNVRKHHNLHVANESFENVGGFMCLGTAKQMKIVCVKKLKLG